MPLGWYYSDPGAKFNSSQVKSAPDARLNTVMLVPVIPRNARKRWQVRIRRGRLAGYVGTGYQIRGSKKTSSSATSGA
jgi:hypothetical protein